MGPNDKILWGRTVTGKPAYMGRRTGAHLDHTIEVLARVHPGAKLHIIQSAYNTGVAASAGTHDKDACLDVYIEGLDWWTSQAFLRKLGWAAWYRYPPSFGRHIHMISLGYGSAPVGRFVPGQVSDYYNHKTGLVGHKNDPSWHPADISSTVFDYRDYLKRKEPQLNAVQEFRVDVAKAISRNKIPANRKAARAMVNAIRTALKIGPKS